MSCAAYSPLPLPSCGGPFGPSPLAATTPSADFCRPVRVDRSTLSPCIHDKRQISRGKFDRLPHATAEFTTGALDGYGLRCHLPTRPAPYASHPVLVHRLVRLLHASFRPRLAATPLRFAITSPPSGCEEDFHLRAVEHARHTTERPRKRAFPFLSDCSRFLRRSQARGPLEFGVGERGSDHATRSRTASPRVRPARYCRRRRWYRICGQ